jgi:jumonji domain-containing protein 7
VDLTLQLAVDAFGFERPEAINLWIGDERSVSSLHKDHFENMYAVIGGEKGFVLFPPTDIAFFEEKSFPATRYKLSKKFNCEESSARIFCDDLDLIDEIDENENKKSINWILDDRIENYYNNNDYKSNDNNDNNNENSNVKLAHGIRVVLRAGELLYIPAMWLHKVFQKKETIAVNYWYEQKFDFRFLFNYFMFF